jgi:hypothetical protein
MDRLVGSWRLTSLRIEFEDTGEIIEPWGTEPLGWLVLTPEGRLITVATAARRLAPTTDPEAAALLASMVSYSGRTRLDGQARFVTDVDVAWHPSWLGTRQARSFALDGDALSVRTDFVTHPAYPGRPLSFILSWQRGN